MCHSRTLSKGHVDVVTGEWAAVVSVCACVHVRVCACVRGKREHKHMCTYGGGSRGNEEDEMMTICPLSCP